MSATFTPLLELPEQLCYVQCSFCNTILLVSVPCCSLWKEVTVGCGHCQGLLSVNMGRASFVPLHLLTSMEDDEYSMQQKHEVFSNVSHDCFSSIISTVSRGEQEAAAEEGDDDDGEREEQEEENEENISVKTVVNKPPEKRQRAPSAYNRFIKEEIQRIKARNPKITHKEAFSAAAKNWAHFPRIQQRGDGESCSVGRAKVGLDDHEGHGFCERKAYRRCT